jgi:hypothetical protein
LAKANDPFPKHGIAPRARYSDPAFGRPFPAHVIHRVMHRVFQRIIDRGAYGTCLSDLPKR